MKAESDHLFISIRIESIRVGKGSFVPSGESVGAPMDNEACEMMGYLYDPCASRSSTLELVRRHLHCMQAGLSWNAFWQQVTASMPGSVFEPNFLCRPSKVLKHVEHDMKRDFPFLSDDSRRMITFT